MHPDLSFLQLKINAIGTALFFCGKHAPLPFSGYVVTALKMDETGCIWFFVRRGPYENIVFETPFAAELAFYRKGYPYVVKIEGSATVEYPENKVQHLLGTSLCLNDSVMDSVMLIKVKMENACYKELRVFSPYHLLTHAADFYRKILQRISGQWRPSPVVYQ
jgi:hypothetical protein